MSDRITIEGIETRARNVNRRIESTGRAVVIGQRNGYVALDEYRTSDHAAIRTITVGTKREVYEYLHAMMVGIDLSRQTPE